MAREGWKPVHASVVESDTADIRERHANRVRYGNVIERIVTPLRHANSRTKTSHSAAWIEVDARLDVLQWLNRLTGHLIALKDVKLEEN